MVKPGVGRVSAAGVNQLEQIGPVGGVVKITGWTALIIHHQASFVLVPSQTCEPVAITVVGKGECRAAGFGHGIAIKQIVLDRPGGITGGGNERDCAVAEKVV